MREIVDIGNPREDQHGQTFRAQRRSPARSTRILKAPFGDGVINLVRDEILTCAWQETPSNSRTHAHDWIEFSGITFDAPGNSLIMQSVQFRAILIRDFHAFASSQDEAGANKGSHVLSFHFVSFPHAEYYTIINTPYIITQFTEMTPVLRSSLFERTATSDASVATRTARFFARVRPV